MFHKEKELLKVAAKHSVQSMMEQERGDWPPKCSLILYQPQRPCNIRKESIRQEPEK